MPNIPSRQAEGSGLDPILPNRAAQLGAVDAEQARFVEDFTSAVSNMNSTTEFQSAMNDHGELLLNATLASEAEPDANKRVEVFKREYDAKAGQIANRVTNTRFRQEFDLKSGAQFGNRMGQIQSNQLKAQRAAGVAELQRMSEVVFKNVLHSNSPTELDQHVLEFESAANNQIMAGGDLQQVTAWKENAIAQMYETVAIDLINRNEFGTLLQRMGYDQNGENYDPKQDELAGMDAGLRSRRRSGAVEEIEAEEQREEDRLKELADTERANHNKRFREGVSKFRLKTHADLWSAQHRGGNSVEDDQRIEAARDHPLALITPMQAAKLLEFNRSAREEDQKAQMDVEAGRSYINGAGINHSDKDAVAQSAAAFEADAMPLIDPENPYPGLTELVNRAGIAVPQVRTILDTGLRKGGADGTAAGVAFQQMNAANRHVADLFSDEEISLMEDAATFFNRGIGADQAWELAVGSRTPTENAEEAEKVLRSDDPGGLLNPAWADPLRARTLDIIAASPSGVPGQTLGAILGDRFPAEMPYEMELEMVDILVPMALQNGGSVTDITPGNEAAAAAHLLKRWGVSAIGDGVPGFRVNPIETLKRPVPNEDGTLSYEAWDTLAREQLLGEVTPWFSGAEMPETAEAARPMIEQWVAGVAADDFTPEDRAMQTELYVSAYDAIVATRESRGLLGSLLFDDEGFIDELLSPPNQAAIGFGSHAGTLDDGPGFPSYRVSLIGRDGVPINLRQLGVGDWVARDADMEFFQAQELLTGVVSEAARLLSIKAHQTSKGSIENHIQKMRLPGSDPGRLLPADVEAAVADRALAFPELGGLQ